MANARKLSRAVIQRVVPQISAYLAQCSEYDVAGLAGEMSAIWDASTIHNKSSDRYFETPWDVDEASALATIVLMDLQMREKIQRAMAGGIGGGFELMESNIMARACWIVTLAATHFPEAQATAFAIWKRFSNVNEEYPDIILPFTFKEFSEGVFAKSKRDQESANSSAPGIAPESKPWNPAFVRVVWIVAAMTALVLVRGCFHLAGV